MAEITIEQWTEYLNRKTHGFVCPICGQEKWQTQPDDDGNVMEVKVSDQNNSFQTNEDGVYDLGEVGDERKVPPPSLLQHLIVIRCGHCGWVGTFDRAFVEREIFGHE